LLVYTFRWEESDPDDRETIVRVVLDVLGDGTEVSLRRVIEPWRTADCGLRTAGAPCAAHDL
jgi:hypothetical protein